MTIRNTREKMNKMDYALTKENLAYMNLFEPFYDLYCSYRDILTNTISDLIEGGAKYVSIDRLKKETNHQVRLLFNDFFEKYTFVFDDDSPRLHVNTIFINRINIYELKDNPNQKEIVLISSFSSFSKFLYHLEWAVAYLIRNKKEKELSRPLDEEIYLLRINKHIQEQAVKGKSNQLSCLDNQTNTCEKLIVYKNLKLVLCNQKGHDVTSTFCLCKTNSKNALRLPVHICFTCNKFFIGRQTLNLYEQLYGTLIVSKVYESSNEEVDYDEFGISDLYKTGYNVREGGMTEVERQLHLKHLIDTNQLSYFAIVRDLEYAIKLHKKYSDRFAVERWKKDLSYVKSLIDNAE